MANEKGELFLGQFRPFLNKFKNTFIRWVIEMLSGQEESVYLNRSSLQKVNLISRVLCNKLP